MCRSCSPWRSVLLGHTGIGASARERRMEAWLWFHRQEAHAVHGVEDVGGGEVELSAGAEQLEVTLEEAREQRPQRRRAGAAQRVGERPVWSSADAAKKMSVFGKRRGSTSLGLGLEGPRCWAFLLTSAGGQPPSSRCGPLYEPTVVSHGLILTYAVSPAEEPQRAVDAP